jgi:hypothetical protein
MKLLWLYAALVFLTGCSKPAVPLCEKYNASLAFNMSGEQVVVIDMPNIKKLAEMLKGLQEGTCRIDFHAEGEKTQL